MSPLRRDLPAGAGLEHPHLILSDTERALAVKIAALADTLRPAFDLLGWTVRTPTMSMALSKIATGSLLFTKGDEGVGHIERVQANTHGKAIVCVQLRVSRAEDLSRGSSPCLTTTRAPPARCKSQWTTSGGSARISCRRQP